MLIEFYFHIPAKMTMRSNMQSHYDLFEYSQVKGINI